MTTKPTALILRTAGTNCDAEMVRAFELAGADPSLVHVDRVVQAPGLIDQADLIGFPGGFSHGDDVAAGRVLAVTLRERLWGPLKAAAERAVPMIGVCNGFQVMVQVGLLPGFGPGAWPDEPPAPTLALAANAGGRFIDRWCRVQAPDATRCIWTRPAIGLDADAARLPIAHAEGRVVAASPDLAADLDAAGQIALRYAPSDNPNGSVADIAGVCDPSGRVFGLMPHPDRFLDWNRHPFMSGRTCRATPGPAPGLAMFEAAVQAAAGVETA